MFFLQLEGARVRRHIDAVDYKQGVDEERASLKRGTQNNQRGWGEKKQYLNVCSHMVRRFRDVRSP